MPAMTFELGGPRIYSYKELLKAIAHEAELRPTLVPIPFAAWYGLVWIAAKRAGHPQPSRTYGDRQSIVAAIGGIQRARNIAALR
jgi:hypothetical protein